ncbi:MAG TPA: hypothetical protein VFQ29_08185, partial [Methyloceanibacter sp.]|nr:hypothetical protein [Methyloceanibacter sp.]
MSVFRVLPALVCVALLAQSHDAAALMQALKPSDGVRGLVLDAVMECGVFDGKFQCRPSRGGELFGKGASPGGAATAPTPATPEPAPGGIMPGPDGGQMP